MKRYQHLSPQHLPPQQRRRGGFTLIELIMVIAIIAALAALIFPAINSVRTNVKVTEVVQEISGLESAIADFKLKFGQTPPSQVTIYETPAGWNSDSQSRAIIRGLWPKFDFSMTRDLDGGGAVSYELKGDQCLVFFLGGFWKPNEGFRGFSPIPTNPFASATSASAPSSPVGPFFDFEISRVVDDDGGVAGVTYPASLEIFPVYFDPISDQQRPYIYASSYEGTGYAVSDVRTPATRPDFSGYVNGGGAPWKPKTFQIISPGFDGEFGYGQTYNPEGTPVLSNTAGVADTAGKDNITNFAGGMLDP